MLYVSLGQCIIALHLLYQDKEYIHIPLNKDTADKKKQVQMGTLLLPVNSVIFRITTIHGLLQYQIVHSIRN